MDASLRLRCVQHDKLGMANLILLSRSVQKERDVCASRQGEVNPVWMLHFVQHDKRCHSKRCEQSILTRNRSGVSLGLCSARVEGQTIEPALTEMVQRKKQC